MIEAFALCQRYSHLRGNWPDIKTIGLFILSNQPRLSLSARCKRFPLATLSISLDTFIANERKNITIRIFPRCLIPHLIIGRNLSDSTETVIGHRFTFNMLLLLGILLGEQKQSHYAPPPNLIHYRLGYLLLPTAGSFTVTKHYLEGLDEGKFHFPLLNIR